MASLLNENPTIRSAADLPSRRRSSSSTGETEDSKYRQLFASIISPSAYPVDPFEEPLASDSSGSDDEEVEPIDEQEIYDLIATMSDPEHPLSLGSLAVVNLPDIHITPLSSNSSSTLRRVLVELTPTITHCSLATVIGLGVRVRLEQSLPPRFRIDVKIKKGTHTSAEEVNKQLGDKERVAAALENKQLWGVLKKMMETCT